MKKRLIAIVVGMAVMVTSVLPVCAEEEAPKTSVESVENQSYGSDDVGTPKECEVECSIGKTFEVTVPKKITIDGSAEIKQAEFEVNVKGDIGGHDIVKVSLDATTDGVMAGENSDSIYVLMKQDGKDDFKAYTVLATGKASDEFLAKDVESTCYADFNTRFNGWTGNVAEGEVEYLYNVAYDSDFVCDEVAFKDADELVGTTISGAINATGISSGAWEGAFSFHVDFSEDVDASNGRE